MGDPVEELQVTMDIRKSRLLAARLAPVISLVPTSPFPLPDGSEGPYAMLARTLYSANDGMIDAELTHTSQYSPHIHWLLRLPDRWRWIIQHGDEWERPFAAHELHRYDPLDPTAALATVFTAWRLDHARTAKLFAEADPGRIPDSWGGVQVASPEQATEEHRRYQARSDIATYAINGQAIETSEQLLRAVADAMHFPGYVGTSWDSVLDQWRDETWLSAAGNILTLYDTQHVWRDLKTETRTFAEYWLDAAVGWAQKGMPFRLLLVW